MTVQLKVQAFGWQQLELTSIMSILSSIKYKSINDVLQTITTVLFIEISFNNTVWTKKYGTYIKFQYPKYSEKINIKYVVKVIPRYESYEKRNFNTKKETRVSLTTLETKRVQKNKIHSSSYRGEWFSRRATKRWREQHTYREFARAYICRGGVFPRTFIPRRERER